MCGLGADVLGGSIPACAGEPPSGKRRIPGIRVHPRVCGGAVARQVSCDQIKGPSPRVRGSPRRGRREDPGMITATTTEVGPSPRVRGSPEDDEAVLRCIGSIPACAGEPSESARSLAS